MYEEHIAALLIDNKSRCPAREAEQRVPPTPGLYAIFVNSADALRQPSPGLCAIPQNKLLYIGIATKSLVARLVEQDLHHLKASSFFRSLGAVLGFKPPVGSLLGRKNQYNYRFSPSDTGTIIEWINAHLLVQWLCTSRALAAVEKEAIRQHSPFLNITHNPTPSPEVKRLRALCRTLARQGP
jgi:hypothetical protein